MAPALQINRDQLAKIIGNDFEAIKQFEALFLTSNTQVSGLTEHVDNLTIQTRQERNWDYIVSICAEWSPC